MSGQPEVDRTEREVRRSMLKLWLGAAVAALVVLFLLLRFMGPAPPRSFRLGAGRPDGVYARHARAYAENLRARDPGLRIEVVETAGAVENLRMLREGELDVALVQGGTAGPEDRERLHSLASVFLEPLWVLHRTDRVAEGLEDLAGLRIAVGEEGSGTRDLALRVLRATGLRQEDADLALDPRGGQAAAEALLAGDVDAAVFVMAPGPAWLADLLGRPDVEALVLPRSEAIARRFPFLQEVRVPRGLLDLDVDAPRRDLSLIAPTAALVARKDFHPALAALLLQAAKRRHAEGSFLAAPGTFPSPHHVDVPLSEDARRALSRGPSWLYRVFPFWFASFLDRAIILLLPLLTLLFPLFKTAPPIYRWGIRRRIYLWYRDVRAIDQAVRERATPEELRRQQAELSRIEAEVAQVKIPLSYMREFYDLRLHLRFVAGRLAAALGASADDADLQDG